MNKLDGFEKSVKNSLENYEVAYDPAQWSRLEKSMGNTAGGNSFSWLAVASVSVVLIGGAALVYNFYGEEEANTIPVNDGIVQNTSDNNQPKNNISDNKTYVVEDNKDFTANSDEVNTPIAGEKEIRELQTGKVTPENKPPVKPVEINPSPQIINNGSPWIGTSVLNPDPNKDKTPEIVKLVPAFSVAEEICMGQSLHLSADNVPVKTTCNWEIEGETEVKGYMMNHTFKYPGTYKVKLTYSSMINGEEKKSITAEKLVVVKPAPSVRFSWDEVYTDGKPFTVFASESDRGNLNWKFADGKVSTEAAPRKFYRNKGVYPVELTVEGENGCINTLTQNVEIEKDYNLLAPNGITPNGDGLNDAFIPEALKVMDVDFTMTIYDRSGRLVYTTKTVDNPWDGKYTADNQVAPEGVYVWVVVIPGEEPYKGNVTLLYK